VLLKATIPEGQSRLDGQETEKLNANKLSRLLLLKAKTCSKASLARAFKKLENLGPNADIRDFMQEHKLLLIQQDQGLWASVEEARSRPRDENARVAARAARAARAEKAEKALEAPKEARAAGITHSICNEPLENRPTTYVTCGFCEEALNQSLEEDATKAEAKSFKSWGPTPPEKSQKEEAEPRSEEDISAAQKQCLIEDLLNSVTGGDSNINWSEIL
jgi:hypothetical protein